MGSGKKARAGLLVTRMKARRRGNHRPRRAAGTGIDASSSNAALVLVAVWMLDEQHGERSAQASDQETVRASLGKVIDRLQIELGRTVTLTELAPDGGGAPDPNLRASAAQAGEPAADMAAGAGAGREADECNTLPAASATTTPSMPPATGAAPTTPGPGLVPRQRSEARQHLTVVDTPPPHKATIRLLGRYTIEGPAHQTVVGRPRDAWLLLGLLLEYRHAPLQRHVVIGKLWPDDDPAGCSGRFWAAMKEARVKLCKALDRPTDHGKYVVQNIGTSSYRLNPGLFGADLWQLRDALASTAGRTGPDRAAALEAAVTRYTGPFLPGAEHEWARSAARALERNIVQVLVQLADLQTDPERSVHWIERATRIDPMAEQLFRRRMHAYAALGRYQAVEHCYTELAEQLHSAGDRPEQRTVQLYRRLIEQAD